MLNKDGRIMLVDFGIARTIYLMQYKVYFNWYRWLMRQKNNTGEREPRSDIYSLEQLCIIYLQVKFLRLLIKTCKKLCAMDFSRLEQIVMKALEYEAEKRYRNAIEKREAYWG
jgi:hypothetical protein